MAKTYILIVAHEPLAHAFKQCALHVFADSGNCVHALDITAEMSGDDAFNRIKEQLALWLGDEHSQAKESLENPNILILTDIFGATPANAVQRAVTDLHARREKKVRAISGLNLPMLLRSITYKNEKYETLIARALEGGVAGVTEITAK